MGDSSDHTPDDWADQVAKWTFILTVILAVLYIGTVLLFIL